MFTGLPDAPVTVTRISASAECSDPETVPGTFRQNHGPLDASHAGWTGCGFRRKVEVVRALPETAGNGTPLDFHPTPVRPRACDGGQAPGISDRRWQTI